VNTRSVSSRAEICFRRSLDHKESFAEADPVSVGLNDVLAGVDADLVPGAEVKGTVRRLDNHAPLIGVEVCAWGLREESYGCAYPEVDGSYSIPELPPDEYEIEFAPLDSAWEIQFWDHTADWEDATLLPLASGSTAVGINADLVLAPQPQAELPLIPPAVQSPQPAALDSPLIAPSLSALSLSPQVIPRCQKGFRKKSVDGKPRCVRKGKRAHHRRPPAR
jgi:hypothetical protein